ncbi:hypothetical protein ACWDTD_20010 [Gordonia sp. NPDC003425]
MAVFFAYAVRRDLLAVFGLRKESAHRIGAISADIAAADERARQMRTLDRLAHPLLERITERESLSHAERMECALLEAHLRDRIRARLMCELGLDDVVDRARRRGVEVVLLDDSTSWVDADTDAASVPAIEILLDAATATLDEASDGQVFVRVAAPGREIAGSVLHRRSDGSTVRIEVMPDGGVS